MLTKHQTTLGTVAVDFFFVISGFLVSRSFVRSKSVDDYAARRFLRIFPGYWASMLFALALVLVSGAAPPGSLRAVPFLVRTVDPASFPCNLCFASNPMPGAVNGSTWSLLYETRCYLFVVFVGLLGGFGMRRWVLHALTVASLAVLLAVDLGNWSVPRPSSAVGLFTGDWTQWPKLFPFFFFGASMSVLDRGVLRVSTTGAVASIGALLLLARVGRGFEPALVVFGSYLLLWVAVHPKIRLHRFSAKGDFSYGVFLYAFPVQQVIVRFVPRIAPLELAIWGAACALPLAVLSWNFVEKPALRRLKHGRLSGNRQLTPDEGRRTGPAADNAP
jgi:peptidoglycan/LPS O-acetylase OafA/YrhL